METQDAGHGLADAVTLAGYVAAYAMWWISEGWPLTPMLVYLRQDGTQRVRGFSSVDAEGAVEEGRQWLNASPADARCAVLLYDMYATLPDTGRTDAVMIEVRSYAPRRDGLKILVPYRNPADQPRGFAVHRPKFMSGGETAPWDLGQLGAAFFAGVHHHRQGGRVWNARLDESK